MTTATWKQKLKALEPCPEAYRWACQFRTLRQAWRACEDGNWMCWLLEKCNEHDMGGACNQTVKWGNGACNCRDHAVNGFWKSFRLADAYIILDFMPDPPELP